jgi:peptidoglycan/LPS O-acetylase OafA/YrhL
MTPVAQTAGGNSGELARRPSAVTKVDPVVEPSAEWGWHQRWPRAAMVLGVLVAIMTLSLLINGHTNWTEFFYVVGTAAVLLLLVLLSARRRRRSWRP